MTKIHTIKIDSTTLDESKIVDVLGLSEVLDEAVASEGATKLTLAGVQNTQCDMTSNYV